MPTWPSVGPGARHTSVEVSEWAQTTYRKVICPGKSPAVNNNKSFLKHHPYDPVQRLSYKANLKKK